MRREDCIIDIALEAGSLFILRDFLALQVKYHSIGYSLTNSVICMQVKRASTFLFDLFDTVPENVSDL